MKPKKSNKERFCHLPVFKGILHFTGVEDCIVYYNEKIVGFGSILSSGGKQFRCLWNTPEQKKYAAILHNSKGRFGVRGYKQDDYVYITSLWNPPTRSLQARRLHRIREAIEYDKEARENLNQAFTGYQSSHNTYIPAALKNVKVKLTKKEKIQEGFDMFPIRKRKHPKREKDDIELEKIKEKRVEELESFYTVRKHLDTTSLRLALIECKYSIADIEAARNLIDMAAKYMSHRAYS